MTPAAEPTASPLVGRDAIRAAVVADLTVRRRSVLLIGEAGVGKTALTAVCAAAIRRSTVHVEHVIATRAGSEIPLGAFAPLLPTAAPSGEVLAWATAHLHEVAAGRQLLVVVDDAHLLDDASCALVHQLVVRGDALVLATVRSGERVSDAITALWKDGYASRRSVPPLGRDSVDAIVARLIGSRPPAHVLERVWALSHGNALFVRHLVAGLLESGALRRHGDVWQIDEDVVIPERVAELVHQQLERLDAVSRHVLELLALGEPLGIEALELLVGPDATSTLETVRLAVRAPDVRRVELRLAHPLYGEVVRQRLTVSNRRRRLRELVGWLEASGARRREDTLRLATYSLGAGADVSDDVLVDAGRQATYRMDLALAERLLRKAWESRGGVAAGQALGELLSGVPSSNAEALEILNAVRARAESPEDVALVACTLSHLLSVYLFRDRAARRVLDDAEVRLAGTVWAKDVAVSRAFLDVQAGRLDQALAVAAPLMHSPEPRLVVSAAIVGAFALGVRGACQQAVEWAQRGVAAHHEIGGGYVHELPFMHAVTAALASVEAGWLDEAEAFLATDEVASAARAYPLAVVRIHHVRAKLELTRGRHATAAEHAQETVRAASKVDWPDGARWGWALLALAEAARRNVDGAVRAIAAMDQVTPRRYRMFDVDVLRARAAVAAAAGDVVTATSQLQAARRLARGQGARALEAAVHHDLARIGHPRSAATALAGLVEAVDGPLVRARALFAGGATRQDPVDLRDAAGAFEAIGAWWWAAEAYAAAAWASADGGPDRGVLATKADVLARRCGTTVAVPGRPDAGGLTPREREVATLASDGTPSKEIARRLGLSVRTVDNHLARVYDKLGVTGRRDLARGLSSDCS
ncbi:MAG TPA: LuxR C-terminal-related transcriptional regulator [Mycobacteriales bacterium]|nr:LuxR C-terminal-related transcriptional regulator [Mycobacteriales bacterium]